MDWSKFIAVNGATAHPHTEPDGTTYNMGNSYGAKGTSQTGRHPSASVRRPLEANRCLSSGASYNIIKVPPTKATAEDTLEGVSVLCSIPSSDKSKPSYYHSFGEPETRIRMESLRPGLRRR